ncbi:MAG: hypothetical protein ACLSHG_00420 [Oscillospiraceae bacterium]
MRASDSSRHAPVPVSRRRKWSHRRGSTGSVTERFAPAATVASVCHTPSGHITAPPP